LLEESRCPRVAEADAPSAGAQQSLLDEKREQPLSGAQIRLRPGAFGGGVERDKCWFMGAHLLIVFGRVGLHWLLQWSYNHFQSTEALDRFFSSKQPLTQVSKKKKIISFQFFC
jgi:hypothetical protein